MVHATNSSGRNEHTPLETIKLNSKDRKALLDKINAQSTSSRYLAERRALRIEFDVPRILFTLIQATGNQVRYAAVPRNLSKRGIAFVLGRFIYPDSPCKVAMPALNGEWISINGTVRICRHLGGVFHETAVVFDEAIDLREFIELTREQEEIARDELAEDLGETMDAEDYSKQILIVDDDKSNRRLLNHFLTQMDLRTREATTPASVYKFTKEEAIDGVIMDINLGEFDGLDVVQQLRSKGYGAPIIAISSDDTAPTRKRASEAGCNGFLAKPYTVEDVKKSLHEAMLLTNDDEDEANLIYSSYRDDDSMISLLSDFVKSVNTTASKLVEANHRSDYEQIERVCKHLKGAGGSYGFKIITDQSNTVMKMFESEMIDFDKIRESVDELIATLRRVRAD